MAESAERVERAHGKRSHKRARLVVGIDELDRIQPVERAREFVDGSR
jgi:hypothetical protein